MASIPDKGRESHAKVVKQGLRRFRWRRRWQRLRFWMISLLVLLVVVGLPSGILWLNFVGLGSRARAEAELALARMGIHATLGKLVISPFDGLVARNIEIQSTTYPGQNRISIRKASLSVRWSALLKRQLEFEKIEVRDGQVTIKLGSAPAIPLDHIQAILLFYPGSVRVPNVSLHYRGIEIRGSGTLLNPEKVQTPAAKSPSLISSSGNTSSQSFNEIALGKWIHSVSDFLDRTTFTGYPPTLEVSFAGNLADISSIRVDHFHLRSGEIKQKGWKITALNLSGDYRNNVLVIRSIDIQDKSGRLMGTIDWHAKKSQLIFEVESSLDIRPFLPSHFQILKDFHFEDILEFSSRGTLQLDDKKLQSQIFGDLHVNRFQWKGIGFDQFDASIAWEDDTLYIKDASIKRNGEAVNIDLLHKLGDVRLRVDGNLNPQPLFFLADAKARETLDFLQILSSPEYHLTLQGDKLDFAHLRGKGNLRVGPTALRGIKIDSAIANLEIADNAITYRDLIVKRPEGIGTGAVVYDMANREVRFQNINSTLNPVDVLSAFDPRLGDAVRPYRFRTPPKVTVNGKIHLKDPNKNHLDVSVDSRSGMEYDLAGKTLPFDFVQGTVRFRGTQLLVDLPKAGLFSGNIKLRTEVSLDSSKPRFQATVLPENVKFFPLSRLYFGYEKTQGLLSGRYQFTSTIKDPMKNMTGEGTILVKDGNVFAMPILGALSLLIEGVLPGVAYENARQASADFRVKNGIVQTDNFLVEGRGFQMQGEGTLDLARDKMNFSVRLNAKGVPGIFLYPVSKIFEYVSDGKLSHPEWRPRILPKVRSGP